MKTIGLIGGMSWESTVTYYWQINQSIKNQLGGLHSAKLVLYSVDFHEIEELQRKDDWESAGVILADAARALERAGADFIAIGANTMHKVAGHVEAAVSIPLLHIVEPAAEAIKDAGFKTVGLLGTQFTMEQSFYRDRLTQRHGLAVIVPEEDERKTVHRIVYEELCRGIILPESRESYLKIISHLAERGAQAVILGCTEISLLISQHDASIPLFDTAALHAQAAAHRALGL